METKFRLSLLFVLILFGPSYLFSQWTQIGSNIYGEAQNDAFGNSTCINSDGTIVGFGAYHNDGVATASGEVKIYKNVGNNWIQLGSELQGDATGDQFGWSLDLNSVGNILAVGIVGYSNSGATRIFQYNGIDWVQMGNDIVGENFNGNLGYSVSLNSSGTIVAVGSPANNDNGELSGQVRVFQYNGSAWIQIGNNINGEAAVDRSGGTVSINSDGTIVAVGASWNDGNGEDSGHVRIFQYNGYSWFKLGNDIDGEYAGDHSGNAVSLSSDGLTLAIGAYYNTENGIISGHARIFEYNGSSWIQKGNDIDGASDYDLFGVSVSLSSDGSTIAIGSSSNDENGNAAGQTRVFSYNGADWQQFGSNINGENSGDMSGVAVALSSSGLNLVIGGAKADFSAIDCGVGRIFGYSTNISEQNYHCPQVVFPNPTNGNFTININEFESVEVMNSTGQIIAKSRSKNIDISDQPDGMYFIRVFTKYGINNQKVLKE